MVAARGGPARAAYGFTPAFEVMLAVALSTRPKLYGLLGKDMDVDRFVNPTVRLVFTAVRAIAKDIGNGPSDVVTVVQRVRQMVTDGTATLAHLEAVQDLFCEGPVVVPPLEEIVALAAPAVRDVKQREALQATITAYGQGGATLEKATRDLVRAGDVGKVDTSMGLRVGVGALAAIRKSRGVERLSTGCTELDIGLGGGLGLGHTGVIGGSSKFGKSMWLTQQAACGMRARFLTTFATLELSEEDQMARLYAHLTGIPIDAVVDGSMDDILVPRLEALLPTMGVCRFKFFPAKRTNMLHIQEWIEEVEAEEGAKVMVNVVDYLDKLGCRDPRITDEYQVQGYAAEEMRLYNHETRRYGWTGSQGKRREKKERRTRMEMDDFADSQGKVRVLDLILTGYKPTPDQVCLYVAANRHGRGEFETSVYQHNLAAAQLIAGGIQGLQVPWRTEDGDNPDPTWGLGP